LLRYQITEIAPLNLEDGKFRPISPLDWLSPADPAQGRIPFWPI
jgi:hypothetical protein